MTTTPALSIVIATVLEDYPYQGRPDLHIFSALTESLLHQNAPPESFELIVVDSMWATRGDWFAGKKLPFRVVHASSFPNVWHAQGRCGANAQMNRGLLWSRGDYVFWGHENCMYPPQFVTEAISVFRRGLFPIAWFLGDAGYMPEGMVYPPSPVPYSMSGYTGTRSIIEHRAKTVLALHGPLPAAPWQWYYTYSGASRELLMAIHGWDTNLDGEGYLVDCDLGSRLAMATSNSIFYMSPELYVIEAQQKIGDWSGNVKKDLPQLKCNYALLKYARRMHQTVGGTELGGDELLEKIAKIACECECEVRAQCQREDVIYPWVPKFERWRFDEWQDKRRRSSFVVDQEGVAARRAPYDQVYVHDPA